MTTQRLFLLSAVLVTAPAFAQVTVPGGTGLYVAPSSGAYALLTTAASQMLTDVQSSVPNPNVVVIYDHATFSNVPYYPSAIAQIKYALTGLCPAPAGLRTSVAPVDVGNAASGLAALIGVTLPAYAINGQAISTIDTSALVGSFASVAKEKSITVINPVYLLPAKVEDEVDCKSYQTSQSIAALWALAATQAQDLAAKLAAAKEDADKAAARKKAIDKAALERYQKLSDVYLAADKGIPLLSKLLIVESLLRSITCPAHTAVIDMKLDGAGIDSTTRTILWWRSTTFSSNVLAHYYILKVDQDDNQLTLTLLKPGSVNFMMKDVPLKQFAGSMTPTGKINGKALVFSGH